MATRIVSASGNELIPNSDGSLLTTYVASTSGSQTVVTKGAATATSTSVASTSVAATTILAANTSRLGATITNVSTSVLLIGLGFAPTATNYTLSMGATASTVSVYYEVPFRYTGLIQGLWLTAANGQANCTEFTA